jgi:hypothetical protein
MGETRMKGEAKRTTLFRDSLEGGVTRQLRICCSWPLAKMGWVFDGRNKFDSVLKVQTSGENRERLANSGRVVAQGLVRFHRVEI